MNQHQTFADLGAPFPLFDAPTSDAADFVRGGRCSLCGVVYPVCFSLGIGSDVVLNCSSCGVANGLDADDRCDEKCRACGDSIAFPPMPEEQILCCYRCLRAGKAAITKDTQLGMISFDRVADGLTHGVPGLRSTEFEIVAGDSGWNRARVDRDVMLELLRTPTYSTIQGERWKFCCGGPMVFVGAWSRADFSARAPGGDGRRHFDRIVEDVVPGLWEDKLHDCTGVYVFRCPCCLKDAAHWDIA